MHRNTQPKPPFVHLLACINLNHKLKARKLLDFIACVHRKEVLYGPGVVRNLSIARVAGKWVTGKEEMDQQSLLSSIRRSKTEGFTTAEIQSVPSCLYSSDPTPIL